ncbi:MAG: hypothetical protein P8Y73_12765, partial [Desulfuromonadales bacterium]
RPQERRQVFPCMWALVFDHQIGQQSQSLAMTEIDGRPRRILCLERPKQVKCGVIFHVSAK